MLRGIGVESGMKTSLDCIPCFLRQAISASRMLSKDPAVHEQIVRKLLSWVCEADFNQSPPVMAQRIHRLLKKISGNGDPYRAAKKDLNRMAMKLLPDLKSQIESAEDPLMAAVRLAIAGNVLDMGVNGNITEWDMRHVIQKAIAEPFTGEWEDFCKAVKRARNILYLADNAGEIVFDRLLIERLSPERVTLVVRGFPVINDATMDDARYVGVDEIVETIGNGSDAPGTILKDCSQEFNRRFTEADLILAKGQGNFETLSDDPHKIFFLFKVKCPVIADHTGFSVGTHVLAKSCQRILDSASGLS